MTKENNSSASYLSLQETRLLLNSITDARDKLMIRLLYETGCSIAELVRIKVSDYAGTKVKIIDSETKEIRFPGISGKLAKDIKSYIEGNLLSKESYLISTRQSKNISEKRVRQLIQHYTEKILNEKINPQSFRYFHIAHAYLSITPFRIFQVLQEMKISPQNHYNMFLKRV